MLKESCLLTSSFMEKVEEAKYSQVSTDTVLDFCMVMDSVLLSMLAIYLSRPPPYISKITYGPGINNMLINLTGLNHYGQSTLANYKPTYH